MRKAKSPAVAWTRQNQDYRHLTDPDLAGWLYPWEWVRLFNRLAKRHPERFKQLLAEDAILPFDPLPSRKSKTALTEILA